MNNDNSMTTVATKKGNPNKTSPTPDEILKKLGKNVPKDNKRSD